ncbi:MAG: restriction endonuclease subunit S, partial [Candidatus Izemoplasmatales bacterium]|nr:restriction endonuclease subunit S [Candidatus Izemoplasmatales bacterium]
YQVIRQNELLFKLIDLENEKTSRVGLSNYDGITSSAYIRVNVNHMNPKYYYYWYYSLWFRYIYNRLGNGVRSTLNAKDLLNIVVPVPPLPEQELIANTIDKKLIKMDRLIKNQENQIEKLKEYKQSLISEVVTKGLNPNIEMKDSGIEWIGKIPSTWLVIKMKLLGVARNGLTYNPNDLVDSGDGTLVLRSSNVQNGRIVLDDNVYVDMIIKNDLFVTKGDILICSRNGSRNLIGKNALIENDVNAAFGAFMMIFRTRTAEAKYLKYILDSSIFNYYLGTYLTATINQLTISNFNNMEVVFTDVLNEQKKIIVFLDNKCNRIDRLVEIKQKKIDSLNDYKKSLIYEYVTGKKEVES